MKFLAELLMTLFVVIIIALGMLALGMALSAVIGYFLFDLMPWAF